MHAHSFAIDFIDEISRRYPHLTISFDTYRNVGSKGISFGVII